MGRAVVLNAKAENDEYMAMLRRTIRAAGVRAGEGDVEDLAELIGLQDDLDAAVAAAVATSRATLGRSWEDIARAAGIRRQTAWERWHADGHGCGTNR